MSPLVAVDDPADPRLADFVGLTDADLRRRVEDAAFIVEGTLAIDRLLASPYPVRSLLVTSKWAGQYESLDAPVYVASQEVMNAVAGFDIHRGALASAARLPLPPPSTLLAGARLVLGLEGINDHENMGALFRNAAAFGADAVVLSPDCCDPLYRRAVRVSLGHVLHVPFTVAPFDLAAPGFTTVALTPDPAATRLDDVPPLERVALLLGAEGPGLRADTLAHAELRVRIPMARGVDSLNVATAAAIALHHFARPV
jgi:tRNA G18 (ribose-2'-O)-methylase SpoU